MIIILYPPFYWQGRKKSKKERRLKKKRRSRKKIYIKNKMRFVIPNEAETIIKKTILVLCVFKAKTE